MMSMKIIRNIFRRKRKNKLVLIGAGGHATSVIDSIDYDEYDFIGFIDDYREGTFCGLPIFGKKMIDVPDYKNVFFLVSIGDCYKRSRLYNHAVCCGCKPVNIIDKTALISPTAKIGEGNFIGKMAVIDGNCIIGNNNIINSKALIEHGCRIANNTNVSTNSTLNGDVIVGDYAYIGSGVVCNGQISIGEFAKVGSGSVVTKDVGELQIVAGIPARSM